MLGFRNFLPRDLRLEVVNSEGNEIVVFFFVMTGNSCANSLAVVYGGSIVTCEPTR